MPKKHQGKKKIDKVLAEITHVRRHQILFSYDSVFLIIFPILTFLAYLILADTYAGLSMYIFILLFLALAVGILGMLRDSIKDRLLGWWLLLGTLIFAYIFVSLITEFGKVTGTKAFLNLVIGLFLSGSLAVGMWLGELIFHFYFLKRFLARLKEAGVTVKKQELPHRTKIISFFGVLGVFLLAVSFLLIYFKPI